MATSHVIQEVKASEYQHSAVADGIALTSADYRFVFHDDPSKFFERGQRPYRLLRTPPPTETYHDAVYLPAVRAPKVKQGSLYDAQLDQIASSVTRRGLSDKKINTDPDRLSIDKNVLPVYEQPVLYLGLLRLHYGHFLMESLSHWWALSEEFPEVERILFHVFDPQVFEKPVVKAALAAMNITRESIVYFDEPTRLSKVIVPTSSFQARSHIYEKYSETLRGLSEALLPRFSERTEQPLYLSRTKETGGVRRYAGEEEVERFLADRGARVIHPGQMPWRDQIKAVNEHKVLIGFQGSQMMNSMFSLEPRTVIHFTDNNLWPNTFLIDRCFNNEAIYVNVADPDKPIRERLQAVMVKFTGSRIKFDKYGGFRNWHRVDHQVAIDWLASTGLV